MIQRTVNRNHKNGAADGWKLYLNYIVLRGCLIPIQTFLTTGHFTDRKPFYCKKKKKKYSKSVDFCVVACGSINNPLQKCPSIHMSVCLHLSYILFGQWSQNQIIIGEDDWRWRKEKEPSSQTALLLIWVKPSCKERAQWIQHRHVLPRNWWDQW